VVAAAAWPTVEAEATSLWHHDGAAGEPIFYVTSVTEAKAERAIRPEAIALGVFGVIAGLAALLIAGQAIGRQLRLRADDLPVLRALGTSPSMIAAEGLIGIGASVVIGALLAVAVAIGLSPLAPIGVVRPVYPDPGVAFDWTVLAPGVRLPGRRPGWVRHRGGPPTEPAPRRPAAAAGRRTRTWPGP
jgi:hypothetical protein